MLVSLNKVQWLHYTGVVDKFVIIWCDVSSWFSVPKITEIGEFLTELFLKNQDGPFLAHPVLSLYRKKMLMHWTTETIDARGKVTTEKF